MGTRYIMDILDVVESMGLDIGEVLRKIQIQYINEGRFLDLKYYQEMGIELKCSEEDVQEGYTIHLREGNLQTIEKLKNVIGIEPKFSEENIQKGYRALLKKGGTDYDFKKLEDITGIEPLLFIRQERAKLNRNKPVGESMDNGFEYWE